MSQIDNWINQVHQGDSLEIIQEIPKESVDCVLTDIPYDEVNRDDNGLRKLDKGNADNMNFNLSDFLKLIINKFTGSIYIFCGFQQVSEIQSFFDSRGLSTRVLTWKKTNPSPLNCQHLWLSDIELCVFAKKSNATFNGKYKSSVLEFPRGSSKQHPTQKPVDIFKKLIRTSTNRNDTVLDPFVGSGTTAVASKEIGREYIGIDKEQEFVDLARRRLEDTEEVEKESENSVFDY